VAGLPHVAAVPQIYPNNFVGPHGFPVWVRYCHFFNFLFVMMLIRSGLSILVDHPRLYFNDGCTPGSEWIRLTPLKVHVTASGPRRTTPVIFRRLLARRATGTQSVLHGLALHRRSRVHHHWHFLRHHALRYRAVAAYCADFPARPLAGMEHLGALRNISHARGAERVLWLQRIAADCLFHRRLCLRSFGDSYRDRHVARSGESLSPGTRGSLVAGNRPDPSTS